MDGKAATARTRRKRRTSEEIVDRIIDAAREEFELNGYTRTKTAAIARRAGVAEALIFTNFGSKAALFQKSIFGPLREQLTDFCANHLANAGQVDETIDGDRREYIHQLQIFVKANSRKLASLVFVHLYGEDVQSVGDVSGLHDYFDRASAMALDHVVIPPRVNPNLASRVTFATVLSCILFRDWLFPEGLATSDEIDDAVINHVIGGLRINDRPKG